MRIPRSAAGTLFVATALVCFFVATAPAAAVLYPPADLAGDSPRADQIVLTWMPGSAPTAGEHYVVYRDGIQIADTTDARIVDEWLVGGRVYEYTVRAANAAGETADAVLEVSTIDAEEFEAGPYLQQLTATHAVVMWQTLQPATTGLDFTAPGAAPVNIVHDATLRRRHAVRLIGLVPGATYTYSWQSGGVVGSASFVAPPSSPQEFSFDVIGDFGTGGPASLANLARIDQGNADFALTVGDNAYPNAAASQFAAYVFAPLKSFLARKPFWPVAGNHDYVGLGNYKRFFDFPDNRLYYRFRFGDVLFVALDSNSFGPKQRAWARRSLTRSDARCKVVAFHHPIWSSGHGYQAPSRHARQRAYVPMLQAGGADLVLSGHVHNYERSRPLRSGHISRRRGIVYVVTGGGGAELGGFATDRKPRWSAKRGIFFERMQFHYSGGRLSGSAIDTAGKVRDRFPVRCR